TLKIYSKGERVLRIETIAQNVGRLRCGKQLAKFPEIVSMLVSILEQFMYHLHCIDASFIDSSLFQTMHQPTITDRQRVAGIDINNPRMLMVMNALIALSIAPFGISPTLLAEKVREMSGATTYLPRHAAYDMKKFMAKGIVERCRPRYYAMTQQGLCHIVAFLTLRDKVLIPLLNQAGELKRGRKPVHREPIDVHYENIQKELQLIFRHYEIAA
ncbi:MAG: hypothetical protein JW795_15885, partial [Chitinivibrionales bacterium]|nr:hypothetical protein [Chitinivibrionales bacterium]